MFPWACPASSTPLRPRCTLRAVGFVHPLATLLSRRKIKLQELQELLLLLARWPWRCCGCRRWCGCRWRSRCCYGVGWCGGATVDVISCDRARRRRRRSSTSSTSSNCLRVVRDAHLQSSEFRLHRLHLLRVSTGARRSSGTGRTLRAQVTSGPSHAGLALRTPRSPRARRARIAVGSPRTSWANLTLGATCSHLAGSPGRARRPDLSR